MKESKSIFFDGEKNHQTFSERMVVFEDVIVSSAQKRENQPLIVTFSAE